MDPDQTLADLRELIAFGDNPAMADEIVERFEALDQWLSRGGFLPTAWAEGR